MGRSPVSVSPATASTACPVQTFTSIIMQTQKHMMKIIIWVVRQRCGLKNSIAYAIVVAGWTKFSSNPVVS
jgi:hypothetical protein